MRLVDRKVHPAGLVSLLSEGGDPPWRLPALHPLVGEKEKGKDGRRTSLNNRQAERWLFAIARGLCSTRDANWLFEN